jgi:thioredoxin 1
MKLLKFYAEWCGPCRMLSKTMETLSIPHEVEEVDIDEDQETPAKYGVRGVPTLILLDDNDKPIVTTTGTLTKSELVEKFGL